MLRPVDSGAWMLLVEIVDLDLDDQIQVADAAAATLAHCHLSLVDVNPLEAESIRNKHE